MNKDTKNFFVAIAIVLAISLFFSAVKIYINSDKGGVLAVVNGVNIYEAELEARHGSIPRQMQNVYTEEVVLDQMIQEELLLQRIHFLNITASEQEIDAKAKEFAEQNALTEAQLSELLQIQGLTRRQFRNNMELKVVVDKLLEREVFSQVNITEGDALEYYNSHAEEFVTPEVSIVRHLLISIDGRSDEEALSIVTEIREMDGDFCDLVITYSEDQAGCVDYDVTRYSGFPEEFVNVALNLRIGERGVAKTKYGYHLILKVGEEPKSITRFEDVKSTIIARLEQEVQKTHYQEYLENLESTSNIQNFLIEEIVEEVEKIPEIFTDADLDVMCISSRATLYGARWDSATKQQLDVFENSEFLNYVDCAVQGSFEMSPECKDAGIQGFPTWLIDGEKEVGFQPVERLLDLTNC